MFLVVEGRGFLGEGLLRALVGAVLLSVLVGGVSTVCDLVVSLVDVCLMPEGATDSLSGSLGWGSGGGGDSKMSTHVLGRG